MNNEKKATIALGFLILFSILDIFLSDKFMMISCDVSKALQNGGGEILIFISLLLSTIFTFWIPLMIILYNHLTNSNKDSFYILFKYFVPVILGVYFKALFYQGRPYLVSPDIQGCTCDPGMPSGHAIMAMSGYYAAYEILMANYPGLKDKMYGQLIKIVFTFLAVSIVVSRSVLAAHSIDQLIMGSLISIWAILYFDRTRFNRIYILLSEHHGKISKSVLIFNLLLAISFIYINHGFRENYEKWKYFDKCKKCMNTLVVSQTLNMGICQLLPAYIACFNYKFYNTRRVNTNSLIETEVVEEVERTDEGFKNTNSYDLYQDKCKRLILYLGLVGLPSGFLMGIHSLCLKFLDFSIYQASILTLAITTPVSFYVGFMMSSGMDIAYLKLELNKKIKEDTQTDEKETTDGKGDLTKPIADVDSI